MEVNMTKSYKLSNGIRNSTNRVSNRKKKYDTVGGPRKYPSKYCWEFIGNSIHCVEVRYFSISQKYHFFKYANGILTRGPQVPTDRMLHDTPIDCYNNRPGVIHPLKEWS
tara:strand:+ start:914 stop:1243 length:330 start_codon:yes stop_codon:yes gene_type:complete